MASIMMDTIKNLGKTKHAVGNLNNWTITGLNLGAIVSGAAMDNFTLGELGFDAQGNRIVSPLTATTKKGILVASVEDYIGEFESISAFYNGVGDRARIVKLEEMKRINISAFVKDDLTRGLANGQKVHYDATNKNYVVSNGASPSADYATAANKFIVVDAEAGSLDGQYLIGIEFIG